MSERPLFRQESEQARATAWLGRVVLIRPMSFTLLTACAMGFAVALAIFFVFGEYTRKARVSGIVAPAQGVVKILAQQSGIVEAGQSRGGAASDQEHGAALDQQARLEASARARRALARELAGAEFGGEPARSRAHAQLAGIDMQRASIEQGPVGRDLQSHAAIVAPAAGMVATVLVERGQMVTPGTPLATLIPANTVLERHLFSPSRSIGFG